MSEISQIKPLTTAKIHGNLKKKTSFWQFEKQNKTCHVWLLSNDPHTERVLALSPAPLQKPSIEKSIPLLRIETVNNISIHTSFVLPEIPSLYVDSFCSVGKS